MKVYIKFFIMLSFFIFCSCSTTKTTSFPLLSVYTSGWSGEILPSYISLKTMPNIYDEYCPSIQESFVGQWHYSNDTLFLIPKYAIIDRDSLKTYILSQQDTSFATIPRTFLIKKDCIIDITDFNIILPEPWKIDKKNDGIVYKRVNYK